MNNIVFLGGSGGIGRSIVREILQQHSYKIINIDRVSLNITDDNYNEIICDLTKVDCNQVIADIFQYIQKIDVFVSCIGYYAVSNIATFSLDEYRKTQLINVEIPCIFSVALAKHMATLSGGKIILISSAAAYVGSRDISYSISKSAVLGLVRGLSKNLKGVPVYVYGIAPGIVETAMSEQMNTLRQNDTITQTLSGRKCSPNEIAKLVTFLLEESTSYMAGSVVHINNGLYFN